MGGRKPDLLSPMGKTARGRYPMGMLKNFKVLLKEKTYLSETLALKKHNFISSSSGGQVVMIPSSTLNLSFPWLFTLSALK